PGVEVSTPAGHVGALGIEESMGEQPDVRTAIRRILELNGLPVAMHPYRFWSGIGETEVRKNEWGAIEGLNARTPLKSNLKAQKLAVDLNLPVIGGSDAHKVEYVGAGYTIVKKVSSWQELINEIKNGRTNVDGSHRSSADSIHYITKSIVKWIGRGFNRM
ncbi:MAG: PHP-associated domain-containing protein, partial [Thermoplasmata archaeon]